MNAAVLLPYILVMAGTTYLIRMLPLTLCRKKIQNRFAQSFLYYLPFAVLGAMTFPALFFATATPWSAAAGLLAALLLAAKGKGLLPVAVIACAAVWVTETLLRLAGWLVL